MAKNPGGSNSFMQPQGGRQPGMGGGIQPGMPFPQPSVQGMNRVMSLPQGLNEMRPAGGGIQPGMPFPPNKPTPYEPPNRTMEPGMPFPQQPQGSPGINRVMSLPQGMGGGIQPGMPFPQQPQSQGLPQPPIGPRDWLPLQPTPPIGRRIWPPLQPTPPIAPGRGGVTGFRGRNG